MFKQGFEFSLIFTNSPPSPLSFKERGNFINLEFEHTIFVNTNKKMVQFLRQLYNIFCYPSLPKRGGLGMSLSHVGEI